MSKKTNTYRSGIILTLPSFLFVFAFLVYPVIYLLRLSLFDYSPLSSSKPQFIAFKNYAGMLTSETVWHSFGVTLAFTFMSVAIEIVVGLFVAVLLSKLLIESSRSLAHRVGRIINSAFILPFAAPAISAAVAWKMMLHPQFGPVNALFGRQIAWFTDYPLFGITIVDAWKMTPFVLFLLLAAILSADPEQYEAARIDGANARQEFIHFTLPSILPVLAVSAAFRAVDAFTKIFDIVFGTTGGGPGNATEVFPLLVWKVAFNYLHFGQASALAVMAIVVSAVLGWLLIMMRRRA